MLLASAGERKVENEKGVELEHPSPYPGVSELAGAPKTAEHPRMLLPSSDGPKPGGAAAAPGMWGSPAQCQPLGCPQTRGAGTQGDPAGKNKTPECILSSFPAKGKQAKGRCRRLVLVWFRGGSWSLIRYTCRLSVVAVVP